MINRKFLQRIGSFAITSALMVSTIFVNVTPVYAVQINNSLVSADTELTSTEIPDKELYNTLLDFADDGDGKLTKAEAARLKYFTTNSNDEISSLKGLEYFTGLKEIQITNSQITSINELSELTNLESLVLRDNAKLSDISPIAGLTSLKKIDLSGCSISDISALAEMTNIEELDVTGNYISNIGNLSGSNFIERLKNLAASSAATGNIVYYDGSQLINKIAFAEGNAITKNMASSVFPEELLNYKVCIYNASSGTYSQTDTTWLSVEAFAETGDSDVIANDASGILDINLYNAIMNKYDADGNGVLTKAEAKKVSALVLDNQQISNITGLQHFVNIKELSLSGNEISDIAVLASLSGLKEINLQDNMIANISSISGLTNLSELDLSSNIISDISPLVGLTGLESLNLSNNQISDVSALKNMSNLDKIDLSYNKITSISSLSKSAFINNLGVFAGASAQTASVAFYDESGDLYKNISIGEGNLISLENAKSVLPSNLVNYKVCKYNNGSYASTSTTWISTERFFEPDDYTIVANNQAGIPDKNFYDAILSEYDFDGDNKLTKAELKRIVNLDVTGREIESICGIAYMENLESFSMADNKVSDISYLADMRLQALDITNNGITGLDALSGSVLLNKIAVVCGNDDNIVVYYDSEGTLVKDFAFGEGNLITKDNALKILPDELLGLMVKEYNAADNSYVDADLKWFDTEAFTGDYKKIESIAITGISNPVGETAFDTEAVCSTEGVTAISEVAWLSDGVVTTEKAGYNKAYSIQLTLSISEGYKISDNVIVTVNGNQAVLEVTDGKVVVSYTFEKTAPMKPEGVTVAADTTTSIQVQWDVVDGAEGYIIYRKAEGETKYTYKGLVTRGSTTSYTDKNVTKGTRYYYYVCSYTFKADGNRNTSKASTVMGAVAGILPATNLKAERNGKSQVKVSWSKADGAQGYIIYRRIGDSGSFSYRYMVNSSTLYYNDTTASESEYNFYRIYPYITVNGTRILGPSTTYVYSKAGLAAATNIKATGVTGGVKLTWSKVKDADGYIIYGRRGDSTTTFSYVGLTSALTYTDTKALKTYYNFYRVYPYYKDEEGKRILGPSNTYVYGKAK